MQLTKRAIPFHSLIATLLVLIRLLLLNSICSSAFFDHCKKHHPNKEAVRWLFSTVCFHICVSFDIHWALSNAGAGKWVSRVESIGGDLVVTWICVFSNVSSTDLDERMRNHIECIGFKRDIRVTGWLGEWSASKHLSRAGDLNQWMLLWLISTVCFHFICVLIRLGESSGVHWRRIWWPQSVDAVVTGLPRVMSQHWMEKSYWTAYNSKRTNKSKTNSTSWRMRNWSTDLLTLELLRDRMLGHDWFLQQVHSLGKLRRECFFAFPKMTGLFGNLSQMT